MTRETATPIDADAARFSDALRRCWAAPTPSSVDAFLRTWPVPGSLALRARFETLVDLGASGIGADGLAMSAEQWAEQISLADAGDEALTRHDDASARDAFEALAASHRTGRHPLPLIEAEAGLGDIARQMGDVAEAQRHYDSALTLARRVGARYIEVRICTSVGYLQLRDIGVVAARESFRRAEQVALGGDWRLERANALVGLGECDARQRRVVSAHRHFLEALAVFDAIGSAQGAANALIGLGDACRMAGWADDYGWFSQALNETQRADASLAPGALARVNALDGLAEAESRRGDTASARRHFGEAARLSLAVGYPVGFAHALQGLGNAAFAGGYLEAALGYYGRARDAYARLDLLTGVADASTGVARAADALREVRVELLARAEAVRAVEMARSRQVRDVDQEEYLGRHGHHYSLALTAAIRHGDIDLFVSTFEALAGRRLAGLRGVALDAEGVRRARFLAQIAAYYATPPREDRSVPADPDPEKERRRRLGRLALGAASPRIAREAFDDVAAGAYEVFEEDGVGGLWDRVVSRHENVVLLCESHDETRLYWLAVSGRSDAPHAGIVDLPKETLDVVAELHRSGLSPAARLEDLHPLAALLPDALREMLPRCGDLVVVPTGRLWSVPWPALPVGESGQLLGECFAVTYSPTLTLLDLPAIESGASRDRSNPDAGPRTVAWWRSDQVVSHSVEAFAGALPGYTAARLASGQQAREALLTGRADLLVLVTHGRPTPEMVHAVELDEAPPVTPADLLAATTPSRLALIACWGAGTPGRRRSDPLSVATMAILRGSEEVLATTSELLDEVVASRFVNQVLFRSLTMPFPRALRASTIELLSNPHYREGPVARWAPLIGLGTGNHNGAVRPGSRGQRLPVDG